MRLAFLVLAVLAASPADAKCHLFSVWHYPKPQRCDVARQMVRFVPSRQSPPIPANPRQDEAPEIALPSLARADLDGGEADEPTRAKVLLRAALEAPNAH
jgi:hypothetical protein